MSTSLDGQYLAALERVAETAKVYRIQQRRPFLNDTRGDSARVIAEKVAKDNLDDALAALDTIASLDTP